jgi:hypothetical protein
MCKRCQGSDSTISQRLDSQLLRQAELAEEMKQIQSAIDHNRKTLALLEKQNARMFPVDKNWATGAFVRWIDTKDHTQYSGTIIGPTSLDQRFWLVQAYGLSYPVEVHANRFFLRAPPIS